MDGERLVLFNTRNNIYKDLRIHIPNNHRRIDMTTYIYINCIDGAN